MELYTFYQFSWLIISFFNIKEKWLPLIGVGIGLVIWLALVILQGFGLSKMAKNRNIKKRWLAFVPFANIYYIGKLAGECSFFGQKMKRAGLYAMLAQILASLFTFATVGAEVYLYLTQGTPQLTQMGTVYWPNLKGAAKVVSNFYDHSMYVLSIFQLIYEVFITILAIGLYRRYERRNHMFLGMLTLFVPISRYIIIFVLRNRKEFDYEAYMRARQEAYARHQQYYNQQNPYNSPYGNPYNRGYGNPYGNPYGQHAGGQNYQNKPNEEPFEEFSSKGKSEDPNDDGFFS